jgi:hypothetical protein
MWTSSRTVGDQPTVGQESDMRLKLLPLRAGKTPMSRCNERATVSDQLRSH